MELVVYSYTIFVMIACAAACTLSIACYLVAKNHMYLFAVGMFVCYFFDLMFIFQNEYLNQGAALSMEGFYGIDQPALKVAFALGVLESLWLLICSYLEKKSLALALGPGIAFVVASFLVIALMPTSPFKQWSFYSLREAFLLWCVFYALLSYAQTDDPLTKARLARHRHLVFATLILIICIVVENTFLIMVWTPSDTLSGSAALLFISERNISENVLILLYAFVTVKAGVNFLKVRRQETPLATSANSHYVDVALPQFCSEYKLTPRERDVLHLILQGKDYQNIASELQLAMGTVKSHTHNILKKTNAASRQDLVQKFWQK